MLNVKVITVERLSKHGLFGRIRKEITVHRLQNFLYYYYLFISALFIYFFILEAWQGESLCSLKGAQQ